MNKIKILICAAGSGGHIYPALSLAEELSRQLDCRLRFLTSGKKLETKLFENVPYLVEYVSILRIPRLKIRNAVILPFQILFFLLKFTSGSLIIIFNLLRHKDDMVIAFGGLNSVVPVLAAKILGIPTLIHEQNAIPGRANRLLGRFADRIAVGFPATVQCFDSRKAVFTGNPLRSSLKRIDWQTAVNRFGLNPDKLTLLVFGGSQGARFLNEAIIKVFSGLNVKERSLWQVIHICGEAGPSEIHALYNSLGVDSRVYAFLQEMEFAYSASDLAVCRAGAMTLAELEFFKLPAIVVPYPLAGSHQEKNAACFAGQGGIVTLRQSAGTVGRLTDLVRELGEDEERRERMKSALRNNMSVNPAVNLARLAREMIRQ